MVGDTMLSMKANMYWYNPIDQMSLILKAYVLSPTMSKSRTGLIWVLNGGAHFRAQISNDAHRILDIGTGTGIWAIDVADEYPSAEVTGTDLSPIQPSWVPPNCHFIVDDVESPWAWTESTPFDYIHGRNLAGSIKDWEELLKTCMRHLGSGGWAEFQEIEFNICSDDDTAKEAKQLQEWRKLTIAASEKFGRSMNVAGDLKKSFTDAGFENIKDDVFKLPIGPWPKNKKLKELGAFGRQNTIDIVEPAALALLTRVSGWSNEEAQVFFASVRQEIKDPKLHLYWRVHFVYGQKPKTVA
ncbi:MAG: hypothetical protein M1834_006644 [Cirrosporium novae-zelandiae]|nr:MAG: hypothetical protein M1834_006644 [Cirrosporium novae-zelandiae]